MARLNFILPFFPTKPVGGVKNFYQFANRLAVRGHRVTMLYSIRRPYKKQRTPVWIRLWITKWRARNVNWFKLLPEITTAIVPEISDRYVPDGDATICTWWQMAYAIEKLSVSKGQKCNLIQDYELWTGQEEKVHQSYALPIKHIVIAEYLQKIVSKYNPIPPVFINTPIDTETFRLHEPIASRKPASVIMMYSEEPRKGTPFGIDALIRLKQLVPELTVTFFSVYDRPASLPAWIDFIRRPGNLPQLYNQHAIFASPSLGEGWALPPAEAMACGCAVVCTDIGGHRDYASDNNTALLVPAENPEVMASKLEQLVTNQSLRVRIAQAGHENIRSKFTWQKAIEDMEKALLSRD